MSRAGRGGSVNHRRRGPIVLVAGAVIFAVAGWQQVAQAAPDPATASSVEAGVDVSFADQVPATSLDTSAAAETGVTEPTTEPTTGSTTGSEAPGVQQARGDAAPTETDLTDLTDPTADPVPASAPTTPAIESTAPAESTEPTEPTEPAEPAEGATQPVVTPDSDTVAPGGTLPIRGSGLTPGSAVRIVLDGTVELAVVEVDVTGDLRADIPIPVDTGEGAHVITALPVVAGSGLRGAATAFRVTAPPAVASFPIQVLALPPSGAGSNTEGTTSTVSPSTVAVGGTLSFSVGGYPAGETVYVKIDDGQYQGLAKVSGADIVATATIGSDGTASASITIPSDLDLGEHTLRFLASAKPASGSGTLGYTHQSDTFTVVAASSGSGSGAGTGGSGSSGTTTDTTASGTSTTDLTTDSTTPGTTTRSTTTAAAGSGSDTSGGSLAATGVDPVVGMAIGLGFMLAGAGMMIGLRRDGEAGHV